MSLSYFSSARAARRMSWFLLFIIGVALTVTLYFVKIHAQSAKRDVRDLTKAIAAEEAAVRVLKAELAYLENPARLSELNEAYIDLAPIPPESERLKADIERMFPLKSEVQK
jgi:hypothetical protein